MGFLYLCMLCVCIIVLCLHLTVETARGGLTEAAQLGINIYQTLTEKKKQEVHYIEALHNSMQDNDYNKLVKVFSYIHRLNLLFQRPRTLPSSHSKH